MKKLVIKKATIKTIEKYHQQGIVELNKEFFNFLKKKTRKGDWEPIWKDFSEATKLNIKVWSIGCVNFYNTSSITDEAKPYLEEIYDTVRLVWSRQKLNCIITYKLDEVKTLNMQNFNNQLLYDIVNILSENSAEKYETLYSRAYYMYNPSTECLKTLIDMITTNITDIRLSSQLFCLRKEMIKLLNRRLKKGE